MFSTVMITMHYALGNKISLTIFYCCFACLYVPLTIVVLVLWAVTFHLARKAIKQKLLQRITYNPFENDEPPMSICNTNGIPEEKPAVTLSASELKLIRIFALMVAVYLMGQFTTNLRIAYLMDLDPDLKLKYDLFINKPHCFKL